MYGDIFDRKCKLCHQTCAECFGPNDNNCNVCKKGLFLLNKKCISSCPLKYFENIDLKLCQKCHSSCKTCKNIYTYSCLSCSETSYYLNLDNSCTESCIRGFHDKKLRKCFICNIKNCLECSSINYCISCGATFYNDEGNCFPQKVLKITFKPVLNPECFQLSFNFYWESFFNSFSFSNIGINNLENSQYKNSYELSNNGNDGVVLNLNFHYKDNVLPGSKLKINIVPPLENDKQMFRVESANSLNFETVLEEYKNCQKPKCYDSTEKTCKDKKKINLEIFEDESDTRIFYLTADQRIDNLFKAMTSVSVISIQDFPKDGFTYKLIKLSNMKIKIQINFNKSLIIKSKLKVHFNLPLLSDACGIELVNNLIFLTIDIQPYYILSNSEKYAIASTSKALGFSDFVSVASMIIDTIMSAGSSMTIRGMWMVQIIRLMRFIDISYPPNVIQTIFKKKPTNTMIIQIPKIPTRNEEKNLIKGTFKTYGVNPYIINNIGNSVINIFLYFFLGFILLLMQPFMKILKKKKNCLSKFVLGGNHFILEFLVWQYLLILILSQIRTFIFFIMIQSMVKTENLSSMGKFNYSFSFFLLIGIILIYINFFVIISLINFPVAKKNRKKNATDLIKDKDLNDSMDMTLDLNIKRTRLSFKNIFSTPINLGNWNPANRENKSKLIIALNTIAYMIITLIFFLPRLFLYIIVIFIIKWINFVIEKTLIKTHSSKRKNEQFRNRFGMLHQDFKNQQLAHEYFLLIDVGRHLLMNINFACLYTFPLIQILFAFGINILFLLFIIIKNPFKKKWGLKIQICYEIIITISLSVGVVLAIFDKYGIKDQYKRFNLGWYLIAASISLQIMIIFNNFRRMLLPYFPKIKMFAYNFHVKVKKGKIIE